MFGTMPASSRSAPEQKPWPAPVSTTTRTSLSWLSASSASRSGIITSNAIAFMRSGRFSVTSATSGRGLSTRTKLMRRAILLERQLARATRARRARSARRTRRLRRRADRRCAAPRTSARRAVVLVRAPWSTNDASVARRAVAAEPQRRRAAGTGSARRRASRSSHARNARRPAAVIVNGRRSRGPGLPGPHELARSSVRQLAVHVARGHVPEPGEAALGLLEQLPAGPRAIVEEPEQRALGGVEDLTFPCGGWTIVVMVDVLEALQRDGYVVLDDAVDAATWKHARDELEPLLADTPYGREDFEGYKTKRVYALFGKTRALDPMATHPRVLEILDAVLGEYQLSAPTGIEIGPGEKAQGAAPRRRVVSDPAPASGAGRQHHVAARATSPKRTARRASFPGRTPGSTQFPTPTRRRSRRSARGFGARVSRQRVARRRCEHDRRTRVSASCCTTRGVAASGREPRAGRAARRRARTLAPRLQELLGYNICRAVHRLRRRPPPAQAA